MQGEDACPWCKYTEWSCKGVEKSCDFKKLKIEKKAIFKQATKEWNDIQRLKLSKEDKDIRDTIDKAQGLRIMIRVLNEELKVPMNEIVKTIGLQELSTMDKIRLTAKVAAMKARRRGK